MPKARKTIPVLDLFTSLQTAIDLAPTVEERKALCFAIERVLMTADAYAGYREAAETAHPVGSPELDQYHRKYYSSKMNY